VPALAAVGGATQVDLAAVVGIAVAVGVRGVAGRLAFVVEADLHAGVGAAHLLADGAAAAAVRGGVERRFTAVGRLLVAVGVARLTAGAVAAMGGAGVARFTVGGRADVVAAAERGHQVGRGVREILAAVAAVAAAVVGVEPWLRAGGDSH